MRALIACEFSGTVRRALAAIAGVEVWSVDLLPAEDGCTDRHIIGDVLARLDDGWDLMIAHPPCTYLSYAATKYWHRPGREEKRAEAMEFFLRLYNAPIPRVCIENPVGVPNTSFRRPDQIVEPFYFGDATRKRTCLWLRGLRPLEHRRTDELFGTATHVPPPAPTYIDGSGKARYFTDAAHGGHERSRFFPGVARAMAEQWGRAT